MYEHVSMNADHFARLPEYRPNSRFIDFVHLKRFQVLSARTLVSFFFAPVQAQARS